MGDDTQASPRTEEQIRRHYEIEKKLALRLRNAPREERKKLYARVYDELFQKVPHHPQLTQKSDPASRRTRVAFQMGYLSRFCDPGATFMEIGPGDCALSLELCRHFKNVFALDVSATITEDGDRPANFHLILSDGTSIDVPPGTIDIIYSYQLIEHVHPDDTREQLRNIYRALAPGGRYVCLTPHRFMGPFDISEGFDDVATGLHLKEYTCAELCRLFRAAGFQRIYSFFGMRGRYAVIGVYPKTMLERLLAPLPHAARKRICTLPGISHMLSLALIAVKQPVL